MMAKKVKHELPSPWGAITSKLPALVLRVSLPPAFSKLLGQIAGAAGVAAVTAGEKLAQRFTHRPNSFMPAHTPERLARLTHKPDAERVGLNRAMHRRQDLLFGAVCGLMAVRSRPRGRSWQTPRMHR